MIKIKFSVLFLCLITTIDCQNCEDGWIKRPNSNSCYFFSTENATKLEAFQKCTDFGTSEPSYLVSINDDTEQSFIGSI